jgi:coenzyme F420 hydrogenase subunit beta
MPRKENVLIAFNELKRTIIDAGLCTSCGACEAACPVHALRIEDDKPQYIHDCSENLEFCPICYDVCPHTEALLLEALGFVTDAPNRRASLGHYRKVMLAQAVDPKLRKLSHSGGVVTAILMNSIRKDFIDSAVVSEEEKTSSLALQPSISLVPDDILAATDAGFFPSAVARAFGKAVHDYGKARIAFVGTPCQVLALRKLESWEHKITGSLKVIIGLMCLWSFSLRKFMKDIENERGIKSGEIKKITLDKDYLLHLEDRIVRIPIAEAKKHILEGCLTCTDYTSQLADISVGSAYPLDEWSVVVVRTKVGEEIFESALEGGIIRIKNLEEEPDVFAHTVAVADFKSRTAMEEVEKIKADGRPIPPATLRLVQPVSKELNLLSSLNVAQMMTREVMSISPDTTVEKLLKMMTKHHHMGYPIVDKKQNLVGIATFRDVMKVAPERRTKVKAEAIGEKKLVTVYPDDTALVAYEKMISHGISRVPVIDRKNPKKILGIVTRTDIMQTLRWPMKIK